LDQVLGFVVWPYLPQTFLQFAEKIGCWKVVSLSWNPLHLGSFI